MLLFFKKAGLAFFLIVCPAARATPRTDAEISLGKAENQRAQQARAQAQARRDLAAAQAQAARLAAARAQQDAAARAAKAAATAAAAGLADATRRRDETQAELAATQRTFAELLPVMLRVSRSPAESLLAAPAPPEQTRQGLALIGALAGALDSRAERLRKELAGEAAAREAAAGQADVLAAQTARQAALTAELTHVVRQARLQVTQAEAEGRQAAQRAADAAAEARTLRDAIAAMDRAAAAAAAAAAREAARADRRHQPLAAQSARARQAALTRPPGAPLARSRLTPPVAGPILHPFGAASDDGPAAGITYAGTPGASVASPCAGRVGFAAPFRSYGRLLIIECGGGYDIVLAGLASLVASPGHAARQGEMLGRMGAGPLYVELRAKGAPVDPAPFLNGKV